LDLDNISHRKLVDVGFEKLAVSPANNKNKWNLSEAVRATVAAGKNARTLQEKKIQLL